MLSPRTRAAACRPPVVGSERAGLVGLTSRAMVVAVGTTSCNSSSRFAPTSTLNVLTPVTLPPGRFRLATSLSSTGSVPIPNTMGIVVVAAWAASAAGVLPGAVITVTCRRTRFIGCLPGKDGALKHILAAFDACAVAVHLDDVNEGLQVGLSERHRSGGELLTHTAAESLDERRVDADCRSNIELGGLKGSLP